MRIPPSLPPSLGGFHIANVYKPLSEKWDSPNPFPALPHPTVLVGDFNSHHPDWGYQDTDLEGDQLQSWASCNDYHLIHDRTCAGSLQLVVTPNQPRAQSWMTSHTANTARL
jgi:endonuclease/exonuclease/phosphatase family metal-dependent hydrolase